MHNSPIMALPAKKNEVKKSITKATKAVVAQETKYAHKGGILLVYLPFPKSTVAQA